jgi:hypothetical protein
MAMFLCLLATGVFEPYVFVFKVDTCASEIFYWCSSFVYMADTALRFFRAQRKSTREGVVLVTDLREIASMYMRDWMFYIDFCSALPVSLIVILRGEQMTERGRLLSGVRMIRLLKFARLPHFLHRLHEISNWPFSTLSVIQFGMMSCLVLHWIACLWASLGADAEESWLHQAKDEYQFLEFVDNHDMYLMSLYWSVTVLSSVGFGDITPRARAEFFWAIVCMVIGGTVWAYVVGCICSMATSMDKHRTAFESQMNDVNIMCAERQFDPSLRSRVQDFYQHAKEFMRMQNYHKTIRDLSPALKGEVVNWMYGSCFKRVWYFDVVDERCARLLTEGMIPKMYAPEEVIEDTVDGCVRCLVFLRSGLCVRKKNLLAPGAHWGLDVILGSEEHHDIEELLDTSSARSINFAFVLKLGKNTIDHAASLVPAFARRLRKAHLRMLFWRGAIAASRATQRLSRPETEIHHSDTPAWDKAGRMMAKVVHLDRILVEAEESGCAPDEVNHLKRRNSIHHSWGLAQSHGHSPLHHRVHRSRSSPDLQKSGEESTSPKKPHVKHPASGPPTPKKQLSPPKSPSPWKELMSAEALPHAPPPKKKPPSFPILSDGHPVEIMQEGSSSADDVSKDRQEKGIGRKVATSFDCQVSSKSDDTDNEGLPVRRRSQSDLSHAKAKAKASTNSPSLSAKTVQLPLSPNRDTVRDAVMTKRCSLSSLSSSGKAESPNRGRIKSPKRDDACSNSCQSVGEEDSDDSASQQASQQGSVSEQLADIRLQIAQSRADTEEEIGCLREDMAQLTSLMNQLLEKFGVVHDKY